MKKLKTIRLYLTAKYLQIHTLSDFTFTFHIYALEKEMATHSSILPGESQGWGSLVGCRLWGRTKSDMTETI